MAPKRPSFQWYPADWMKDPAVQSRSYAARGLWFEMLMLMDQSPRRGYLQQNSGKPVTPALLARLTGGTTRQVARLLQELADAEVYSSTKEGIIYSRRMVRDTLARGANTERQQRSRAQKRGFGGNRHAPVTPLSQRSSSSSSTSVTPRSPPEGDDFTDDAQAVQDEIARRASEKPPCGALHAAWQPSKELDAALAALGKPGYWAIAPKVRDNLWGAIDGTSEKLVIEALHKAAGEKDPKRRTIQAALAAVRTMTGSAGFRVGKDAPQEAEPIKDF